MWTYGVRIDQAFITRNLHKTPSRKATKRSKQRPPKGSFQFSSSRYPAFETPMFMMPRVPDTIRYLHVSAPQTPPARSVWPIDRAISIQNWHKHGKSATNVPSSMGCVYIVGRYICTYVCRYMYLHTVTYACISQSFARDFDGTSKLGITRNFMGYLVVISCWGCKLWSQIVTTTMTRTTTT